jgi:hypothetical protein
MNRYKPATPRAALGIAAVAMSAITFGVSVVMPARIDSDSREPRMLAASKVTTPAPTSVVTGSWSIDVVAVHEPGLATVPCTSSEPNRKPEG